MDGVYRVHQEDGRTLDEWVVAAPGPMGFRWFGRVRAPGVEEDLRLVDHTVDRAFRVVRFRLMDLEAGVETMAIADPSGMRVSRAGGPDPGEWTVPGAVAVWSSSPSSLFVAARMAASTAAETVASALVDPVGPPGPAEVRLRLDDEGAAGVISVFGRDSDVAFRDGWPVRAAGWFELIEGSEGELSRP
jgi:hypothetical protein